MVTDRMTPLQVDGRVIHTIGMPYHWGPNGYARGDSMNELSSMSLDPSSHIQEVKALPSTSSPGRRPRGPAPGAGARLPQRAGITARDGDGAVSDRRRRPLIDPARRRRSSRRRRLGGAPAPDGLLHRHLGVHRLQGVRGGVQGVERRARGRPELDRLLARQPQGLGADTWRHVAFIEQRVPLGGHAANFQREEDGFRWLMSSDVCKHCTHAACLDVCPTGAIFRTEFGTVVVQADICNGCGYCVPACPYGVLDKREDDGRIFKCTLCYDRLEVGQEPACAKACPTDSIQFGELDELRERRRRRVEQLHEAGVTEARLYGHDPDDGVGGDGAFFLLLDEPEVYGLPPDPVVDHPRPAAMWRRRLAAVAARRRAASSSEPAVSARRSPARAWGRAARATRRGLAGRGNDQRDGVAGAGRRTTIPALLLRQPIINPPVWEERDIAGYLFAGGLAGASLDPGRRRRPQRPAAAGAARQAVRDGRDRRLARRAGQRPGPPGAVPEHAARGQADLADEHRHVDPVRLRAAERRGSAASELPGIAPRAGRAAGVGAGVLGAAVATYTAALIADTAVPAWHEGQRELAVPVRRLCGRRGGRLRR